MRISNYNVFDIVRKIIATSLPNTTDKDFTVEYPKNKECGDFATNALMIILKKHKININEMFESFKNSIMSNPFVASVELAGPGFVNIKMHQHFWHEFIRCNNNSDGITIGANKKVLVEFVSANPTGPMHVGHCRGAVFGDVICNILSVCGYNVTRQYYINDAGEQIATLARSLYYRYNQLYGKDDVMDEDLYPGQYLIEIAKLLRDEYGDELLNQDFSVISTKLSDFAVNHIMNIIKGDLKSLKIEHNSFVSEKYEIHNLIEDAIDILTKKNLIYQGELEAPKGVGINDWKQETQTIFKSTEFGDDVDRVVKRANGSYTYFAGDIGLAFYRSKQNYDSILMVLGADHIGFIKRLKAIMNAFDRKLAFDVLTTQMVNLIKDKQPFKMSKRSGNFITAEDVVSEVGCDAVRFMMLWKKNDTIVDFDFDIIKEKSKENPLFYVQYAYARCNSILENAKELSIHAYEHYLELLTDFDMELIKKAASFQKVIIQSAMFYEPHRLVHFLYELATELNTFWSKGNSEFDLRFIIEDNKNLTSARLKVVEVIMKTLENGMLILSITPMKKM